MGDIFTIPIDEGRCGVGQIAVDRNEEPYIGIRDLVVDGKALDDGIVATAAPLLAALSSDGELYVGHWPIIGNRTDNLDGMPQPASKFEQYGTMHLESRDPSVSRPATERELEVLRYRNVVAPVRLEKAPKAYHGGASGTSATANSRRSTRSRRPGWSRCGPDGTVHDGRWGAASLVDPAPRIASFPWTWRTSGRPLEPTARRNGGTPPRDWTDTTSGPRAPGTLRFSGHHRRMGGDPAVGGRVQLAQMVSTVRMKRHFRFDGRREVETEFAYRNFQDRDARVMELCMIELPLGNMILLDAASEIAAGIALIESLTSGDAFESFLEVFDRPNVQDDFNLS